ncbi:hypothetical protein TVAG_120470 [Trichomonas vaginalis G3]|uniref:Uncharacterized protein n=1 Tax=Trichomonas vaginalis (strain ATCC PRA-98 / G3) TaxID=412133 RepID=A2D7J2_TRIV3|nr:hypothetical protein TVAGG3_0993520 [Trichomonas vaginalis G3]EAY23709.1 hypothetical protein TVAG_120470 [Trichomonas vaginalis G3]KAI5490204.1 hypothetical protein TVAGG3_0993520 [Trichomonas vaginalis G3]|eukprot:XP_001276957.1 hypothetical protein [Trichomonas vaginalis G3]
MAERNILSNPENAFLRILDYFDYNSPNCEYIIDCIADFLRIYKLFDSFFEQNLDFEPEYNNYFDSLSNIFKICLENGKIDEIIECYSDLKEIILFSANIIFENENIINNSQKLIQIALDLLEEKVSFIASVFISRCFGKRIAVPEDLEDFSIVISEYDGSDAKYCSVMVYTMAGLSSYMITEDMQNEVIEFANSNIIIADNFIGTLISYVSNLGYETNCIQMEKIEDPFSRDEESDFIRSCMFCLL